MGNVFDPKRLIKNNQDQQPGIDNLPMSVDKKKCTLLINGYLRNTMDVEIQFIIPMDVIDIIGVFHPYLQMIEQNAAKICNIAAKSESGRDTLGRIFAMDKVNQVTKYLSEEYSKLGYFQNVDPNKLIVNFFYYQRDILDKDAVGAYFNMNDDKLMEYLDLHNFKEIPVDIALRYFISGCSLPASAQRIDLFMEKYAQKYTMDNDDGYNDLSVDDVYILSYSILMLNSSLHNPKVRNSMTKDVFKQTTRLSLTNSNSKAKQLLESLDDIYDRVKATPLT